MKRTLLYMFSFICFFITLGICNLTFAVEEIPAEVNVINFYFTSDVHGNALPTSKSIGYSKFKEYIDADYANYKFIFDAGDAFSGDNFANLSSGENIANIMKSIGYSHMALGYHDFDYGQENLDVLLQIANVEGMAINILNENKYEYGSYKILSAGDYKIGVLGISAPYAKTLLPDKNTDKLNFIDVEKLADTTQKAVSVLKANGADFVIALTHLGTEGMSPTSVDIATKVSGIDVIIDGNNTTTHKNGNIAYPGYIQGKTPIIAQVGQNFESFGVVSLKVDANKQIQSLTSTSKDINDMASFDGNIHLTQQINQILYDQNKQKNEIISQTPIFLNGEDIYTQTGSTNLTNIVTTAIKERTGADIVLINSGVINSSISEGDIKINNIANVIPGSNYIVTTTVTGRQLIDMINSHMVWYTDNFPHFSGLNIIAEKYSNIDGINASGIINAYVDEELINENTIFTIATTDYMYEGSSGYVFENPILKKHGTIFDIIFRYFNEKSPEIIEEFSNEKRLITLENSIDETTLLSKLELPISAPVEISLTQNAAISSDVIRTLKGQDRNFSANILLERPYTITFNGVSIEDESVINFDAVISQTLPENKRSASSADENAIYVDLSNNVTLPKDTYLKFYVGDIYAPETVLYLYYYDINNDILDLNLDGIIVEPSGYITIPVEKSTVYMLNSKLLNAAIFYTLPSTLAPYTQGVSIILLIFAVWVVLFFLVKKYKHKKSNSK